MKVLAGDIQFYDERDIEGRKAVIFSAVELALDADYNFEQLLESYDAYLIPSAYGGKIEDLR
jgi:hypothetical protein